MPYPDTNALAFVAGRRPSFDNKGNVRGFRSVAGATSSPRNYNPTEMGEDTRLSSGLTASGAWDKFFKRPGATTAPSLAPQLAPDAPAMAQAFNFMDGLTEQPFSLMRSPVAAPAAVAQTNLATPRGAYASQSGSIFSENPDSVVPILHNPQPGTQITTQYGKGSVAVPANDWMQKIKRMATSGNMEWPTTL